MMANNTTIGFGDEVVIETGSQEIRVLHGNERYRPDLDDLSSAVS